MSLYGVQLLRSRMRSVSAAGTYAKPKAVAMDYRLSASEFTTGLFDATALALHLKYPISILGMTSGHAAPAGAGYAFVQSIMAADPTHVVGQYMIATQQFDSVSGGATFSSIWSNLDAGWGGGTSYWAKNVATGLKTKTGQVASYSAYEVNLCRAYTTANGSGNKASEIIANGYYSIMLSNLYTAGVRAVFMDNFWGCPGSFTTANTVDTAGNDLGSLKLGDYDLNGTNDTRTNSDWNTRNNAPNPEFRLGMAACANRLKVLMPLLKIAGNVDSDTLTDATFANSSLGTTEYATGSATGGKVVDYGYIEGLTAAAGSVNTSNMRTCIDAYRGNFSDTMNRYRTQNDGAALGAFCGVYLKTLTETTSRTLQKARYGLGVSMLGDGWAAIADRGLGASNMKPYWFDELDQLIGDASETWPSAAGVGYDGMWKRTYTNGLVVVNPSANKGRWMQNAPFGITISRSSLGVVTLTWGTVAQNKIGSLRTWVNGVTKVRLTDSTQIGGTVTYDGTFTITGNTANTLTWADARATASTTNPDGFLQTLSTVDLTGQGYRYFLGDDDAHNDYEGGTSQNDGTTATTVKLWSGDAVLLLRS